MDYHSQLQLQAYLDEELPASEAREVANQIERDPQAKALLSELQNTDNAMKGFETGVSLPESREFFWSKIARQIEADTPLKEKRRPVFWLSRLQRFLVPASAVALLAVVLILSVSRSNATQPGEMELVSKEMGALTFRSQSERMTLVWLYPRNDSEIVSMAPPVDLDPE